MTVSAAKKTAPKGFTAADKKGNQLLETAVKTGPIVQGTAGKVGENVKRILRVAGYGSMMNKSDLIGGGTVNALKAFQTARGLPVTGQVDLPTLKSMENLLLHMRKNGDRFAGVGQRSSAIKQDEARLKSLGYDVGKVDGVYDKQDAQAIAAYRKDEGGKLAKGSALLTKNAEKSLADESKALRHDPYRSRVKRTKERLRLDALTEKEVAKKCADDTVGVREGDKGRAVLNIQAHLKSAGFDPKHLNGKFDERTKGALEAFQRRSGLEPTGVVDPKTWSKLKNARILAKDSFSPSQKLNEKSSSVKRAEELLRKLGYKKVKADGLFDKRTEGAVRAFEKKYKLKVNGDVSGAEFQKMKKVLASRQPNLNTVKGCAQFLLKSKNVQFWSGLSSGSDRKNVVRLAQGKPAFVPATGGFVTPKLNLMKALVAMAKAGPIQINALTGGIHSPNSNHYRGTAVDLDIGVGNTSRIVAIANKYGGIRNFETSHIHLDF